MAMSSDAVYNTSRGSVRPWKQTVLGLGIGTLIGSNLILRILNRLGYTLCYDEVKALETEFAFATEESGQVAPDGIQLVPDLATGLAWDNYDVNMDTLDGKDTLHATVGICYQNKTYTTSLQQFDTRRGRNRRQFEGRACEIAPMHRQLNKAKFEFPPPDDRQDSAVTQRMLDFYWLLMSREMPQPLFAGFFSQFVHDSLPVQRITYMDPIPQSPTRNDVVRETMKRSLQVAYETNQEYTVVTYDLAVALKAYLIQSIEAPLFDRLLIMLGNFHLELAFYGAIGTYVNDSGAEYLLTECEVLAEGSLNGFIKGKHYKRCSRIHQILAVVMERKLYESFLTTVSEEVKDDVSSLLRELIPEAATEESLRSSAKLTEHLELYEKFFSKAMEGGMGPTAQYWCCYIHLINRVHRDLMRAVRTNDIENYLKILPFVIDVFFALNRPNYARWGVLFLEQLKTADPSIRSVLEKGAFSIRRTSQPFSRTAIDLTLEQTVNRDAASAMKGIVGFHNSPNAIRRWCITSTQRGMSVTELRRMTGLLPEEQTRSQVQASRIKKDNRYIQDLLKAVTESCDPFSEPAITSSCLLNIATGKAATSTTKDYLTEAIKIGRELQLKFREECAKDSSRLLKPIKRRKVNNFANESPKPKSAGATSNRVVASQRDIFIRMLVLVSQTTNFDLKHVCSFPITDVPLSISHPDGSRQGTNKSLLLKKLETMQDGLESLPHIDVCLIDGGLLIHEYLAGLGNIPSYGNVARGLLSHVCKDFWKADETHILFDRYLPNSLKESERKLRGAENHPFVIAGSEQRPKQRCKTLLQNGMFKEELAKFLIIEWQKDHYGAIVGRRTIVLSHGGNCIRLKNHQPENKISVDRPEVLQGDHEEADTLIGFHASHTNGTLLIRASDTDVLIIILGMLGRNKRDGIPMKTIIMDCCSGNQRRYLNVTAIAATLEEKQAGLAAALPGLHAFTGCDFTASFFRKGKVKPFEVLEKDNSGEFIQFFQSLTKREEPDNKIAESYVCSLYGMAALSDVDEARYQKVIRMTGKISKVIFEHYLLNELKLADTNTSNAI